MSKIENDTWSKCTEQLNLGCPVTVNVATAQLLHLRFGEHERGGRKTERTVRLSSKTYTLIKPQQYGYLNRA